MNMRLLTNEYVCWSTVGVHVDEAEVRIRGVMR